jgi:hypothetical protein
VTIVERLCAAKLYHARRRMDRPQGPDLEWSVTPAMLWTRVRSVIQLLRRPRMLKVGDAAPAFSVPDQNGRTIRLADYRGRRVILWFYPKADTPG